jgi:DNA-binding LytR/AlgR family response regulator
MTIIPYKEIHCFEKLLTTIKIHTDRGDYVVKEQFKKLLKTLEGDVFFRCHNNYIVNIENIDHIDDKYCHFTRIKKKVPIAGKYRLKLIEKLPR